MNPKIKYLLAFCLIALILSGAAQILLSTCRGDEQNDEYDQSFWLQVARNAWSYFQPGLGVNTRTGLHCAGLYWSFFTNWDLGTYIQATIDAEQLGILSKTISWGADARFEKIINYLENRELTPVGLPYLLYSSETGQKSSDQETNACDTGKLLIALYNLKIHRPDLASRIDYIVYNRTNYEPFTHGWDSLVSRLSIYDYYVTKGFSLFWPQKFNQISQTFLNAIVSAAPLDTYGVRLPKASLSSEVLLHSIFELEPNTQVLSLFRQVYSAQEARYNATGKFVAFSEGNSDLDNPTYVYELVVSPDGRTWIIKDLTDADVTITPIIYLKAAIGFQAIFSTDFTRNMTHYLLTHIPAPYSGYLDGIDENGRVISTVIDKTNGLIIEAAKYAINNLPEPTPTPDPTSNSFIPKLKSLPPFTTVPSQTGTPTTAPSQTSPPTTPSQTSPPVPTANPTTSASITSAPVSSPPASSTPIPSVSPQGVGDEQHGATEILVSAAIGSSLVIAFLIVELRRKRFVNRGNT